MAEIVKEKYLFKINVSINDNNSTMHSTYKNRLVQSIPYLPLSDESFLPTVWKYLLIQNNVNVDTFFSSGTSGNPKSIYFSQDDIDRTTDYLKHFCQIEGITSGYRVAVLLDQFFWGAGFFTNIGHIKVNNSVIPMDTGLSKAAILSILNMMKPEVLSGVPSVLVDLMDGFNEISHIKYIETTGEVLTNETRKLLENYFRAEVFDAYGLTEALIGVECYQHDGYHYDSDYIYVEVIDPESCKILPNEEIGEIVITSFMNQTSPIIRYRTGDRGKISNGSCKCGRDLPRVWVEGRIKNTHALPDGGNISNEFIKNSICEVLHENREFNVIVEGRVVCIYIEGQVDSQQKDSIIEKLTNSSFDISSLVSTGELAFRVVSK
jgi:phenylacetate-CoA ligase